MNEIDHRLKYFDNEQLAFVDSMIPLLEREGLVKESQRLHDCGRKYNAFSCSKNENHPHTEFIFPHRCELRICPRCTKKRGYEVRKRAHEILKRIDKTSTHKYSLLTLTLRKREGNQLSTDRLRTFNKYVRKLINTLYPKKNNCGAIAVMEIGPNMNIHAHVLVYGPFIDQKIISKAWQRITGDSYIVDVRTARDQKIALFYITKYVLKPPSFPEMQKYVDFLKALDGVRRLSRYGIFYGFKVETREKCVCPYCGSSIKYLSTVAFENAEYFEDYWTIINSIKENSENEG